MFFKKIILISLLLTTLNANADTQSTQKIRVNLELLRLKKEVELQEKKFNSSQNEATTVKKALFELLRTNDQPKTTHEQEEYNEKFAKLSRELRNAELSSRCAGYDLNDAKEKLYQYEHPIKANLPIIVGGCAALLYFVTAVYCACSSNAAANADAGNKNNKSAA